MVFERALVHNTAWSQCEKEWKQALNNNEAFGAQVADLSKVPDCLSHELLIAKLDAYIFTVKTL